MKNSLLALCILNIESWEPIQNEFIDFMTADKLEEVEFADFMHQTTNVLQQNYLCDDEEEDDEECYELTEEELLFARLKVELKELLDNHPNNLIYAGYADCMDEAIRFLVEEENISPEHPVVKNLKIHLEKSKERIFQTFFDEDSISVEAEKTVVSGADHIENCFKLTDGIFSELL